ncbi:DUF1572 family protein [Sporosarcina sp. Te-1]|uniref:DUF1572 family protein n=1 Tax=Sporosarcina sp. Te-1 TaxID=2818390 RepID=UPI001A9ECB0C|nr:DUF1572 family protein [Sporosarcina sp. Te-1]QTD43100.1 DUF1572 family protein [Sporosarcina sp. Te-1]
MSIGIEYLRVIQERSATLKDQAERTFKQLNEEDFYWTTNETSNSIAILIQHMAGNMISRWTDFLTTDGEKPSRNREAEFIEARLSREELLSVWEKGWAVFFRALAELTEEDLLKIIRIRGQQHSALDAIERQMVHYAAHVGQIMFIGKQIKGDGWKSLSIPKGDSAAYLEKMLKEHQSTN